MPGTNETMSGNIVNTMFAMSLLHLHLRRLHGDIEAHARAIS